MPSTDTHKSKRGLASADAATRRRVASAGGRSRGRKGGQAGGNHQTESSTRNEDNNFWEDLLGNE